MALGKAMEEFAGKYNLMTTEENLDRAVETVGEDFWGVTTHIRVFARMSPPGKARVIRSLQERQNAYVLMCGDGSNDVGALKQADVGLALLSGYGVFPSPPSPTSQPVDQSTHPTACFPHR